MSVHDNTLVTAKAVKAAPGETPREVQVDLGGTFEFTNHYDDYPLFEIIFEKPGPPGGNLNGTSKEPILLHMPHEWTEYHYHIVYKKKDGSSKEEKDGPFLARSCPGCK